MMFDPNIQSPFWGEIILGLRANELTNKLSYTTPQKNTPSTYTCIPPPLPLFPPLFCGMIICLPLNLKIDTYAPSIGFTYESRQCPMISSALFSVGFVLKLNYIEASS